jgi:SAM-dependent methyltransferase
VVDLGAGTGALTRLLPDRADEVVAVEPDDRMRAVLEEEVPTARALAGRGEAIPLPDGSVNAVVASSSWHWMDPVLTFREVRRVLAPGGTLAAVWSGPDPDGALMTQAKEILAARGSGGSGGDGDGDLAGLILGDGSRPVSTLEVPSEVNFARPDQEVFSWDMALSADEILGILSTMSWIITLPDDARQRVIDQARELLKDVLGIEGEVTIDVGFKAQAWRTRPNPG